MRVLGIDEAGRGCVLGSLAIGAFIPSVSDDALREAGVDDSKRLSAKRREAIAAALRDMGEGEVRLVTAAEIDAGNLNHLEEAVIIDLIRTLRPDRVILDALGHPRTLPALCQRLARAIGPHAPPILARPKADADFPAVGAASILAKVRRDAELAAHQAEHEPFGSGYPSDPKTRRWLQARLAEGSLPPFVRTRWGTLDALRQQALAASAGSLS